MIFKDSYTYRYTDSSATSITFVDDNGSQHTFSASPTNRNYVEFEKLNITPETTNFRI